MPISDRGFISPLTIRNMPAAMSPANRKKHSKSVGILGSAVGFFLRFAAIGSSVFLWLKIGLYSGHLNNLRPKRGSFQND